MNTHLRGIWAPLITPICGGAVDVVSTRDMVRRLSPIVDGFVPCLSTGEGEYLSNAQWHKVIQTVTRATAKPTVAGIKRSNVNDVVRLSRAAHRAGCVAVLVPVPPGKFSERRSFLKRVIRQSALPVGLYLTPADKDLSVQQVKSFLLLNPPFVKDSTGTSRSQRQLLRICRTVDPEITVLQGMENLMYESRRGDGNIVALTNLEPMLVRQMTKKPSQRLQALINRRFEEYNLGGNEWYVTIKAMLYGKGKIRSAEQVVKGS